jgi:gas vesicle protein
MKLKIIVESKMKNNNEFKLSFEGFLIGGIAGGLMALLMAPQSGVETRHDINKYMRFARIKRHKLISDAKIKSKELVKRAAEVKAKTREFAEGKYSGSVEGLEKEIRSLKAGINKAVEVYKNQHGESSTDRMVEEIFVNFDKNDFEMDDNSPKHEGMNKRY